MSNIISALTFATLLALPASAPTDWEVTALAHSRFERERKLSHV